MLISNIVPFMATAAAVFAPAAAAWDYKLKWHSKTTCSTKGGPTRSYDRGTCIPLSKTDHGVTVVDHRTPCRGKREKETYPLVFSTWLPTVFPYPNKYHC